MKSKLKGMEKMAVCRRAPHGARGLKYIRQVDDLIRIGRAPHGARGLKSFRTLHHVPLWRVAPRTGRAD